MTAIIHRKGMEGDLENAQLMLEKEMKPLRANSL